MMEYTIIHMRKGKISSEIKRPLTKTIEVTNQRFTKGKLHVKQNQKRKQILAV